MSTLYWMQCYSFCEVGYVAQGLLFSKFKHILPKLGLGATHGYTSRSVSSSNSSLISGLEIGVKFA